MKQATTNTGVLHCVQDDDEEQATAKTSNSKEQATAKENKQQRTNFQLVTFRTGKVNG
jgi:hypothetical protein